MVNVRRLPKNGTIAVTAPATTPDELALNNGIQYLESLGYRVEVGQTCSSQEHYLAGTDTLRSQELNRFFADPKIDAIFCARGGYGGMHLLDSLDYSMIRNHPKLLCGFSDITSLQWGIYAKTGVPGISGAMVATDFGDLPRDAGMEEQFWNLIESGVTQIPLDYSSIIERTYEGVLIAGTLAVAAKQMGSPYFPNLRDHILVLEDIDEPQHKIEGYLRQFLLAGAFDGVKLTLIGACTPPEKESYASVPDLDTIIDRVFTQHGHTCYKGIRYGHIKNKISLPVGSSISVSLGPASYLRSTGSLYSF